MWAAREPGSPISPRHARCPCRSLVPRPLRWPRDAAPWIADAGVLLLSGRSLFLTHRGAGRMGGGGSALRVCAEHRGGINWLSLSPDGQRLLTGSEDGTARLWSTADGQCCALLQGRPAAPCLPPLSLCLLRLLVCLPQTSVLPPADPIPKVQPPPTPRHSWKGARLGPASNQSGAHGLGGARWGRVGAQSRLRSGSVG